MANAFDFELKADDQVSASIQRIDETIKNLLPSLEKTQTGLRLGGQESVDGLTTLNEKFQGMAANARDGVQFIGDMVPPLKMVAGMSVGLGATAKIIGMVKSGIEDFVGSGYRMETTAKNISMTTQAFQQLTGAMVENGSARKDAEDSISSFFERANEAAQGRGDQSIVAILHRYGIGISTTKEGLADVNKLISDLGQQMQNITPGDQALIARKLGLSPELLSYLRLSTDEVQRLKDQAQRDGLIWGPQAFKNVDVMRQQLNRTAAAWDGLKMRFEAGLGGIMANNPTQKKLDSASNRASQDQSILDNIDSDTNFQSQLSGADKMALRFGVLTDSMRQQYQARYGARDTALSFQQEVKQLYVKPPANAVNLGNNAQEQRQLTQLENQYKLPAGILNHVYQAESGGGKNLFSPAGAEGPFQFMPDTGLDYGLNNHADRMDFGKSSEASAKYLSDLLKMFDGDVAKAVAAYNWGPTRVKAHGLYHAPKETRDYLARVLPGLPDYSPIDNQNDQDYGTTVTNINSTVPPQTGSSSQTSGISDALVAALKDNKMQIELTLVNSQTGEKQVITAQGPKISTSMNY